MNSAALRRSAIRLTAAIILAGMAFGVYYRATRDSRMIAECKSRLLARVDPTGAADTDTLVKLGWLVRLDVHLRHQTIKTNAAMEVYQSMLGKNFELKEPRFFGMMREHPERPAEMTVWAYREDLPAVEKILAHFDATAQE